jgi:hypothetical protein
VKKSQNWPDCSRQSEGEDERARPFSANALATIAELAQHWGERMLAAGDAASRWQIASVASLTSHAPSVTLLPLLKRLLDDNLRRYRAFCEEAEANGWRPGEALNEARMPLTHEYMRAFLSIKGPETAALMEEYLADRHFGQLAASVFAAAVANLGVVLAALVSVLGRNHSQTDGRGHLEIVPKNAPRSRSHSRA